VKKVTEEFTELRFNTGISQLMVFVNEANKQETLPKQELKGFLQLLSAIAPHLAEELWSRLGEDRSISRSSWPVHDEQMLIEDEIEIIIQVNGKLRAKAVVPRDADEKDLESTAMEQEKIVQELEGKTVRKVIAIPGKLVNIVAN
jgi:leucyl-tRNA synthetase